MADALTDEELRQELIAFGMKNVAPITDTTRSLLLKKLSKLKAASKKPKNASPRKLPARKLLGFSSDESEDENSRASSSSTRKRASRAKPKVQPDTNKNRETGFSRPPLRQRRKGPDVTTQSFFSMVNNNRSTTYTQKTDDPDGFQSSDTDEETSASPEMVSHAVNTSPSLDDSNNSFNRTYTRLPSIPTEVSVVRGRLGGVPSKTSPPGPLTSTPEKSARSKSGHNTYNDGQNSRSFLPLQSAHLTSNNTRNNSLYSNHNVPDDSLVEERDILKKGFKTKEDTCTYKYTQYISVVLLVIAVLFFAVLGFMYLNMKRSDGSINDNLLICHEKGIGSDSERECFERPSVSRALEVIGGLFDDLSKRAGDVECGQRSEELGRNMSVAEAKKLMQAKFSKNIKEGAGVEDTFKVVLKLIAANPHWGLRLYDGHGGATNSSEIVQYLDCSNPSMSLPCRLQKAMTKVLILILVLFTGCLIGLLVMMYMRWRWRRQDAESKEIYEMVEKIIDILKTHHESYESNKDLQPYLAIPHVRDMLIEPKSRRSKQRVWNLAVKFLAANESRIRAETQVISGEEYEVWRWLQGCPNGNKGKVWQGQEKFLPEMAANESCIRAETQVISGEEYEFWRWLQGCPNGNKGKVWQGQAFGEHGDGSLNALHYSFTPCLKIRNMFDPEMEYGNNWHIYIQDAILEKCKGKHDIVHIAVDRTSKEGLVYVKCTSTEAAGKVYRSLHGWWFDGNLVTVKYLRLERYHERFPEAENYTSPLVPSNNKMMSLSEPYYKSPMETC